MSWTSPSPAETRRAGCVLGQLLLDSSARGVALCGPLGAGKTHFVKGVAEGLGIAPGLVTSPTFVIANEFAAPGGSGRLVHADLYRVESVAELEAAGWLDWLDDRTWLVVEWADRFPDQLPADHLAVRFRPVAGEPEARCLEARGAGPAAADLAARWMRALGAP